MNSPVRKSGILSELLISLCLSAPLCLAPESWAKDAAQDVVSLRPARPNYRDGDQAFRERKDSAQAQKALELFRSYYEKNPADPDAAWRVSMGCYFAGLHLAKDDNAKEPLFAEGRDIGLKAIELDSNCAPCHFWTAINMALYGQSVGVFKMFFSIPTIRKHLERSISIDPAYAGAGATRLLGLIEQKLPGILGGSDDKAREYFEKAIALAPDEHLNYLFLMKLLDSKFDDEAGAREIAKKGLTLPPPPADRIESQGSLVEMQNYLKDHS